MKTLGFAIAIISMACWFSSHWYGFVSVFGVGNYSVSTILNQSSLSLEVYDYGFPYRSLGSPTQFSVAPHSSGVFYQPEPFLKTIFGKFVFDFDGNFNFGFSFPYFAVALPIFLAGLLLALMKRPYINVPSAE